MTQPIANHKITPYASRADFCRIFQEDMTGLYLFAYLLTANGQKAELCFVSGLDDSTKGNPVFKNWAHAWARRTVVQNAVRLINPQPVEEAAGSNRISEDAVSANRSERMLWTERTEILAILELPAFERFVFVMSVLHRYSDQECSILLGCTPREVIAARSQAMRTLGNSSGASLQEVHAKACFEETLPHGPGYAGSGGQATRT
jgi:hypothetical protein